jgi:hypothetical protein
VPVLGPSPAGGLDHRAVDATHLVADEDGVNLGDSIGPHQGDEGRDEGPLGDIAERIGPALSPSLRAGVARGRRMSAQPAPLVLASTGDSAFNLPTSYLRCPALSLPLLQADGLPLRLQILGKPGQDRPPSSAARWLVGRGRGAARG